MTVTIKNYSDLLALIEKAQANGYDVFYSSNSNGYLTVTLEGDTVVKEFKTTSDTADFTSFTNDYITTGTAIEVS